MTVTDIRDYKSKQVKVFLDDDFAFVLYKGELAEYGIKIDSLLQRETYDRIVGELLVKRAKLRCLKLLTDRPYSEAALRAKLEEGLYPAGVIDDALDYVKSFGYIDDEAYARDLYDSLSGRNSVGVIRQKMKQKGISDDIIKKCLEDTDRIRENEDELILSLIGKKSRGEYPVDPEGEAKLFRYLAGKGFSYSRIKTAYAIYKERLDDEGIGES